MYRASGLGEKSAFLIKGRGCHEPSHDSGSRSPRPPRYACAPALAQQAAESRSSDIIVTARRVEERLQDVPISITVFNQEQLDQPQHRQRAAIWRPTRPSLSANRGSAPRRPSFAIRGFVQELGTAAVGRRLFRRRRRAARRAQGGTTAGDGAGAGHVLRPAERAGAEGPARHAVRPQHHRRRGAAGAAASRPTSSRAMSRARSATTTCAASRRWSTCRWPTPSACASASTA